MGSLSRIGSSRRTGFENEPPGAVAAGTSIACCASINTPPMLLWLVRPHISLLSRPVLSSSAVVICPHRDAVSCARLPGRRSDVHRKVPSPPSLPHSDQPTTFTMIAASILSFIHSFVYSACGAMPAAHTIKQIPSQIPSQTCRTVAQCRGRGCGRGHLHRPPAAVAVVLRLHRGHLQPLRASDSSACSFQRCGLSRCSTSSQPAAAQRLRTTCMNAAC